jgi:hypothetical protein
MTLRSFDKLKLPVTHFYQVELIRTFFILMFIVWQCKSFNSTLCYFNCGCTPLAHRNRFDVTIPQVTHFLLLVMISFIKKVCSNSIRNQVFLMLSLNHFHLFFPLFFLPASNQFVDQNSEYFHIFTIDMTQFRTQKYHLS